jgi:ketosteroid isomerase-like protein
MSARNVEIARRAIEAYNREDFPSVLALAHEDVAVYATDAMPNPGDFRGHAGFVEWAEQWAEAWDSFSLEIIEIEAIDDRHVLAAIRQIGRGRVSGLELSMEVAHLYEIDEDGRIVRFQLHVERADALANVKA